MNRKWRYVLGFSFGLGLVAGCQTYHPETGQTLPSPHYLRHPPQYFPPSPAFPLTKEAAALEEAAAQQIQIVPR